MIRDSSKDIAVTGLFGRFPACSNINEWWSGLKEGKVFTTRYERKTLLDAGIPVSLVDDPDYVPVRGHLENANQFDNKVFCLSPREAELMDPQHRLMLEAAWSALEDSGTGISDERPITGVYASGSGSGYLRTMLSGGPLDSATLDQALHGTEPDFIASLISYKLNLTGPAIAIQTACSSSLVSLHLASQALLNGDCDQALVVAAGIGFPQAGHLYIEGGIKSASGVCCPFDETADGVVEGSGVACVVLRRLADASRDGHDLHGVILGSAVNNDGASKVGYYAPSAAGQEAVIKTALIIADVEASSIGYLEAHATGTRVGDLIEWSAASAAYKEMGASTAQIAVGTLKANIGHLDSAAGLASLIKTLIVLKTGIVPPMAGFKQLNSLLETGNSPLFVPTKTGQWTGTQPRRAGISSFGIGGTNAHVIIEQPAKTEPIRHGENSQEKLIVLSAADEDALIRSAKQCSEHLLDEQPDIVDVSFTLARRTMQSKRLAVCGRTSAEIGHSLAENRAVIRSDAQENHPPPCFFLFPGQGAQYPGMATPFASVLPNFKTALDQCLDSFDPDLAKEISAALFDQSFSEKKLESTKLAQPVMFAIEYAVAVALMSIGISPVALIGHSFGEITAACVAGVFRLQDAARFVAARGRAMQRCAVGSMLTVSCGEEKTRELIAASGLDLSLSAINTRENCVVAGPSESINAFQNSLGEDVFTRRLRTSHAFHSRLMDPALPILKDELLQIPLESPAMAIASNSTGHLIMPGTVVDSDIFLKQVNQPVRFFDGLVAACKRFPNACAVEIGPGRALSSMAKAMGLKSIALLPIQSSSTGRPIIEAIGELWVKGLPVDLKQLSRPGRPIHLPTYPFAGPVWLAPEIVSRASTELKATQKKTDSSKSAETGRQDTFSVMRDLWEDVLGYRDLTEDSDFFDLGGDSLLITNLALKIKHRLKVQVPLRVMLSARTLSRQTRIVSELLAPTSLNGPERE